MTTKKAADSPKVLADPTLEELNGYYDLSIKIFKDHPRNPRRVTGSTPWTSLEINKNRWSVSKIETGEWRWTKEDVNLSLDKLRKGMVVFPDPLRAVQATEDYEDIKAGELVFTSGHRRAVMATILAHIRQEDVLIPVMIRRDKINSPQTLRELRTANRGRVELTAWETINMMLSVKKELEEEAKRRGEKRDGDGMNTAIATNLGYTKSYVSQCLQIAERMAIDTDLSDALSCQQPLSIQKCLRYIKEPTRIGIDWDDDVPFIYSKATGQALTAAGNALKGDKKGKKGEDEKEEKSEAPTNSKPADSSAGASSATPPAKPEGKASTASPAQSAEKPVSDSSSVPKPPDPAANSATPPAKPAASESQDAAKAPEGPRLEETDEEYKARLAQAMKEAEEEAEEETGLLDEMALDPSKVQHHIVGRPIEPEGALDARKLMHLRKNLPLGGDILEILNTMCKRAPESDGEVLNRLRRAPDLNTKIRIFNTTRVLLVGCFGLLSKEHQIMFDELLNSTWKQGVKEEMWSDPKEVSES